MRDLHSRIDVVPVVPPVLVLDATVPAAAAIDLQGFNSCELEISVGLKSVDTGTITIQLDHADDDGTGVAGAYSNVAAADMLGVTPASGIIHTIDCDADASTSNVFRYGYVGGKRFIKVTTAEVGANANGVIVGVNAIKGNPDNGPTS
ncbi:MAG: hypothetical protein OEV73_00445 [Desulfobulbaceae bacterium]|nr:hypothetical protein [Desulfobulbaceae bacterium]